ncbi:acyltransferase [Rossellomorea aquimaris]|nr:acyltransferase [Rossellomorea aquimaris]WRP06320.1 acyltransferase [Rossellomorea aquimaris]
MKRNLKNLISVSYTLIKFLVIKMFHWKSFKFSLIERFSPNTEIDIGKNARLILNKRVRAHSHTKLRVRNSAELIVGENTAFNYGCIITSHHKIKIGKNSIFGPNVLVYDHDHDFRTAGGVKENKYRTSPVEIGDNVWIGANTVILRGTKIGNNCVIGSGSIVKGEYPDNVIIVQKRETQSIPIQ